MIFDTHAHFDDAAFDGDRSELLSQLNNNGVKYVCNVGANIKGSEASIKLAKAYDYFYAAVGVHPEDAAELNDEKLKYLKTLSSNDKVVAIGEIGLDYYYPDFDKELQQKWFLEQMELARCVKLPIVVHSRDAAKDTYDIMKAAKAEEIGGVVHCYSYSKEIARDYLNMGFFFGIGGVLTFKNAKKLVEVVEYLPMDAIVLETDAPYLAPVPFRGKRNDSSLLSYVVTKISEIKGISEKEVEDITLKNAFKLYGLEK